MMWTCRRYRIYGRDFETKDFFSYALGSAKKKSTVEERLRELVAEKVCPGAHGALPQIPIDQKYIDEANRTGKRLGRKIKRFFKGF